MVNVAAQADLSGGSSLTATYTQFLQSSLSGGSSLATTYTQIIQAILSGGSTYTQNPLGIAYSIGADLAGGSAFTITIPTPLSTDPSTGREPYRVIVCDNQGTRYAELENAVLGNATWILNDVGVFDFTLPTLDAKTVHCIPTQREVQLWRGLTLLWWGVILKARGDDKSVNFQCVSLEWYFTRRVVGTVPRPNMLTNGGFELGEANWNFTNAVSHVTDIATTISGHKSLKLVQGVTGADKFVRQLVTYTNPVISGRPQTLTIVGWAYISAMSGSAKGGRGLFIQATNTANSKRLAPAGVGLTASVPKGRWLRLETSINIPNDGVAYSIDTRLYSPNGTIYWDEITLTVSEHLGYYNVDQNSIITGLITHAQDATKGKSDLKIGTNIPTTGIKRTREYFTQDRLQISEALKEFPTLFDGMDLAMTYTPTTRTMRGYYPRKGVDSPQALVLGQNILSFGLDIDGDQTSTQVIVQADGEGSDREEGIATDSTLLNGLVLEKVYNATPGSAISSLQQQASRGLARYRKPVNIPSITTYQASGDLLTKVFTGDRVPVRIDYGWVQANSQYRITQISLAPATDQITFTVTPEDSNIVVILPYNSKGWRYFQQAQSPITGAANTLPVQSNVAYAAASFDDSSWALGQAAIGWTGGLLGSITRNTTITVQNELWMRKQVLCTGDMVLYARLDNFAYLYVNGNLVTGSYLTAADNTNQNPERGPHLIPAAWLNPNGVQIIALHVQDKLAGYGTGDILVGDVQVVGSYDAYQAQLGTH